MTLAAKPLRRDAAENRKRLLTAAARVFAEHGPDAGVEEVARVAGVGMGTLYRRFPTKQALVDELVGDLRDELAGVARTARRQPDALALQHLLRGAGGLLFAHRGCLHQLWQQSDAEVQFLEEFRLGVADALQRSQRAGTARPELVPSDVTVALWSARGVIEMTGSVAPDAWKRHLEVIMAGWRPSADPLVQAALTVPQLRILTGVGRVVRSSRRPEDPAH